MFTFSWEDLKETGRSEPLTSHNFDSWFPVQFPPLWFEFFYGTRLCSGAHLSLLSHSSHHLGKLNLTYLLTLCSPPVHVDSLPLLFPGPLSPPIPLLQRQAWIIPFSNSYQIHNFEEWAVTGYYNYNSFKQSMKIACVQPLSLLKKFQREDICVLP